MSPLETAIAIGRTGCFKLLLGGFWLAQKLQPAAGAAQRSRAARTAHATPGSPTTKTMISSTTPRT
eukprot:6596307-Lingulodinium_polyedra.AAC.1